MVVKPIVYSARACENDVSCFTLSFCAPFVTKLTDVRRQNARRPSPRRRTSAILVGLYQNRNTLSKCRVIPNRREESQHRHMRFLIASLCRNDKMISNYILTQLMFLQNVYFLHFSLKKVSEMFAGYIFCFYLCTRFRKAATT